MQHDKHHILLEEGSHPSMELLRQYQEDVLPPNLSHQVEKHLLACELCADVLEGMTLSGADKTKAAVGDINQRIAAKSKQERKKTVVPTWQLAAAVLLLLCSAFVVVYYNLSKLKQEQNTIAAEQDINSAINLSLPAVPDLNIEIPDSAGESEKRSIASAPPNLLSKKNVPLITKPDIEKVNSVAEEELMDEEVLEENERYTLKVLPNVDTPTIAAASPAAVESKVSVTESVTAIKADVLSVVPESTNVSRTLQGKAPGIAIRGLSSIRKDDAAGKVVSGQVLSEDGQPLPGVTVQLKGTGTGTTTDAAGNYVLPVTGKNPTLLFQYIGFASTEKAVAENTATINVNMAPDNKALSEVVVTGYGTANAPAVVAATPVSGRKAYKKYLNENLRIPAGSEGERGRVVVSFTVTSSGNVTEVKVLKSLCPPCDAEAVRLVKEGPAWQPATQAGNPVPQQVKVSVQFKQ